MFSVETYSAYINVGLSNLLSAKADTNHNHSTWTKYTPNDYLQMWVNPQLRLVDMYYYRTDYNFAKANTVYTLHEGKNYSTTFGGTYKPSHSTPYSVFNTTMYGRIATDGTITVARTLAGTTNIHMSCMYHY